MRPGLTVRNDRIVCHIYIITLSVGAKIIKNMSAACPKLEEIQLIAMKGPAKACNFEKIKFGPALREFHCKSLSDRPG